MSASKYDKYYTRNNSSVKMLMTNSSALKIWCLSYTEKVCKNQSNSSFYECYMKSKKKKKKGKKRPRYKINLKHY